ncbi:MAG: outer membrane protein assembly factor BamD [Candidatus Eisenbacteria bacterium]
MAAIVAVLAGCSRGSGGTPAFGPAGDFEAALDEYERGHLVAAIEMLEGFERSHPGSQYIDDALYYLGKAHQGNNEHLLARQAFERVFTDFPQSPRAEDARFEYARSWYLAVRGPELDAEPAEEALVAFRTYLRRFPEGSHRAEVDEAIADLLGTLARKDFMNGATYLRLGRKEAARRYFTKSLDTWEQSPSSAQAMDAIARSYESEGDWAAARSAYERVLEHLQENPDRYEEGRKLAARAREKLAELPAAGG